MVDLLTAGPLFLVGAQRSGTTGLGYALAAGYARRGGCFTVNGKLFYLTARWLRADDLAARHLRVDELLHALDRRPAGGEDAPAWRRRVEAALRAVGAEAAAGRLADRPGTALELTRRVAEAGYGTGAWGDKYNEYLLELPYLDALYPQARWIFLYRRPAEVVASMLAWTGDRPWRPADPAGCERKWAGWNERWLAFRDRVAPGRRLELSYDTLCGPDGAARVGEFTGLDMAAADLARRRPAVSGDPVTEEGAEVWARLSTVEHPVRAVAR
jgi:Sulfotransferase family